MGTGICRDDFLHDYYFSPLLEQFLRRCVQAVIKPLQIKLSKLKKSFLKLSFNSALHPSVKSELCLRAPSE